MRRTAALIGAELRLLDAHPHGTTFELRMAAACAPVRAAPERGLPDVQASRPLDVLVVDDETEVTESLCTYLRQLGWSTRGVADGAAAQRELAGDRACDVVVVDYRLRDENGIDVIAALRRLSGALPAIIVTGDSAPQRLVELGAAGIRVLHKPVDGVRLARALIDATSGASTLLNH